MLLASSKLFRIYPQASTHLIPFEDRVHRFINKVQNFYLFVFKFQN
jgi:hypothetical protein